MKANELRIGNLVQLDGLKRPIKVSIIDTTETNSITKYKPIILTEEWLLKFGFERDGKYDFELKVNGIYFRGMCDDRQPINTSISIFNLPDCAIKVKQVHQLQNLYFALTGQELTLKDI